MSKKYIVAIIFKNGMKLCSKPMSKRKANAIFERERNDFYSAMRYADELYNFEDSTFRVEDIFMITMVEEQKNQ